MRTTRFGMHTLALGSSRESTIRAGIDIDRHIVRLFVLRSRRCRRRSSTSRATPAPMSSATNPTTCRPSPPWCSVGTEPLRRHRVHRWHAAGLAHPGDDGQRPRDHERAAVLSAGGRGHHPHHRRLPGPAPSLAIELEEGMTRRPHRPVTLMRSQRRVRTVKRSIIGRAGVALAGVSLLLGVAPVGAQSGGPAADHCQVSIDFVPGQIGITFYTGWSAVRVPRPRTSMSTRSCTTGRIVGIPTKRGRSSRRSRPTSRRAGYWSDGPACVHRLREGRDGRGPSRGHHRRAHERAGRAGQHAVGPLRRWRARRRRR